MHNNGREHGKYYIIIQRSGLRNSNVENDSQNLDNRMDAGCLYGVSEGFHRQYNLARRAHIQCAFEYGL